MGVSLCAADKPPLVDAPARCGYGCWAVPRLPLAPPPPLRLRSVAEEQQAQEQRQEGQEGALAGLRRRSLMGEFAGQVFSKAVQGLLWHVLRAACAGGFPKACDEPLSDWSCLC